MHRRDALGRLLAAAATVAARPAPGWAAAWTLEGSPELVTTAGRVRGYRDRGIAAFKGIPYGADTAPRRFQAPVPPAPWDGVRDATAFGRIAPQPTWRPDAMGEDCLHLNVWTPALGDGAKRPVLVWFHPGAFSSDHSNHLEMDGARLARRGDVVVITVNHRLNAFGHAYLADLGGPALADSGNAGMLDLVLALRWVRAHAARLGGDPGNVTIFGQSGGGAKCATLMAMPAARGLFHRVWTMSGQQITASRRETAQRHARQLLDALGLTPERAGELATLPTERIVEMSRKAAYFGPVKDGRALVRDPFDPDAPPQSAALPMVLGNTRGETRTLIGRGDPSIFDLTWDTLAAKLENSSPFMGPLDRGAVIAAYRRWYPAYSPADVFFASTTASRSWRGQVIEAERRAADPVSAAHTWVFQLDWQSPIDGGKWGAYHGLDVPLVFDNVALAPQMVGTGPEAQGVADQLSGALIAFARTGRPQATGLPTWPAYDLQRRATLIVDRTPAIVDDPRGDERRLFSPVPYVQPGT
jgi:para-nitrobenzyl esterase